MVMSAERPSVRITDAGTAGTGRMMAVGPPNFRDVTAEKVGTVVAIIGATAAGKGTKPGMTDAA
jgi:hypothetical protein